MHLYQNLPQVRFQKPLENILFAAFAIYLENVYRLVPQADFPQGTFHGQERPTVPGLGFRL